MMLAVVRFLTQLIKFLLVVLPLMVSGWLVLAVLLLFVPRTQLMLPRAFRWYDCVDSYIGRDTSVYEAVCAKGWWARYCWLAWRNPINYFGYMHLGFQFTPEGFYSKVDSTQFSVGDTSTPGFRFIEYRQAEDGKPYYEYYLIKKWSATKCLRFRFGWKIANVSNPIGSYCQWVMVFQPWKDYSGV